MAVSDFIAAAREAGRSDDEIIRNLPRRERNFAADAIRQGRTAEEVLENLLGPMNLRPRPLSIRHPLEAVGRAVTIGESLAGGVRATGGLASVPRITGPGAILRGLVRDPRAFGRGTMQALRSGYNWQDATQEIAAGQEPRSPAITGALMGLRSVLQPGVPTSIDPRLAEEADQAVAGLVRGIAYDPITYVPFGLPFKIAGRIVPSSVKAGIRAMRPARAIARGAEAAAEVGGAERVFRRTMQAEELPLRELGARATRIEEAAGEPIVSGVVRAREEARSVVYRRVGAEERAGLRTEVRDTGRAWRSSRTELTQARRRVSYYEGRQSVARRAARRNPTASTEAAVVREEAKYADAIVRRNSATTRLATNRTAYDAVSKYRGARVFRTPAGQLTRIPASRAWKEAVAAAERRAIPEAEAASRQAYEAGLTQLERRFGKEYSDEVAGILREHAEYQARMLPRAVAAGRVTEEGAQKWGSDYLWRGFQKHQYADDYIASVKQVNPTLAVQLEAENAARAAYGSAGRTGVRAGTRKARTLVGRETAEEMGELSFTQRLTIGERTAAFDAAETARLRHFGNRWGLTQGQFDSQIAKTGQADWWTKVPETERWGALQDAPFIPKWMAAHLGINLPGSGWANRLSRLSSWGLPARTGEMTGGWYEAVGIWKWFHAVGNLPTQFRNMQTNAALTYLVGKIPAAAVPGAMANGLQAVLRRSPEFRRALRLDAGFGSGTLTRAELGVWQDAVGKSGWIESMPRGLRDAAQGMSQMYEISEQSAKMAIFLYHTRRGMLEMDAANLAMKAVFDYGDVPRIVNWLRRTGFVPFATYPYKATRALVPAMIADTGRFATLTKGIRAPGYAADTESRQEELAAQPEWAKGSSMRLPIKTPEGDTLYLDVGYMLPWGPWEEGLGLRWFQLAPIPRIFEDIKRNQSSFTGRQIADPSLPAEERNKAHAWYFMESMGPGWVVRGIPRTARAVQGRNRSRFAADPQTPSLGRTIAGEFLGIRTRPLSVRQQTGLRGLEIRRAKKDALSTIARTTRRVRDEEITPEEGERIKAGVRAEFNRKLQEHRTRLQRQRSAGIERNAPR